MVKRNNPRKGVAPPLHLGVVNIEKGAFGLPSNKVTNFTDLPNLFTSSKMQQKIILYTRVQLV